MNRSNKLFWIIGFISTLIGFLAKILYRDYINRLGIDDFGLAGFLPSYFYVLGFSQMLLIKPVKYSWIIISVVTFASIGYEFMQIHSTGHLDIPDIIASAMGGATSFLAFYIVTQKPLKE